MQILTKSYQNNWNSIYKNCFSTKRINHIMKSIQNTLKIQDNKDEGINSEIYDFVEKACEILFKMYISHPRLVFNLSIFGNKIPYNPLKVESLDGFIKNGEETIIILPSLYKDSINGELLSKPMVLPLDYEFP